MIASFDIGEKNFCFCIGTVDNIIAWENINVFNKSKQTIIESCIMISEILVANKHFFNDCLHVLIERQMINNIRAVQISQHVWTWFSIIYPNIEITMCPSSLKTQHFISKNHLSAKARKAWSSNKAIEILQQRNDVVNLEKLTSTKKKDDMADTLLQLIAFANTKLPKLHAFAKENVVDPVLAKKDDSDSSSSENWDEWDENDDKYN